MQSVEWIKDGEEVLAMVLRTKYLPDATEFLTPDSYKQQVGFIVYKQGKEIAPHDHKPLERKLIGTSEVLVLKKGKVEASVYSAKRELVQKVILNEGDLLLLVAGGHGFKMIEDSVLLEIKQGPYTGLQEKERF